MKNIHKMYSRQILFKYFKHVFEHLCLILQDDS